MTQPATNAQAALTAATECFAMIRLPSPQSVISHADQFLRWLNANTPSPVDQPGELA